MYLNLHGLSIEQEEHQNNEIIDVDDIGDQEEFEMQISEWADIKRKDGINMEYADKFEEEDIKEYDGDDSCQYIPNPEAEDENFSSESEEDWEYNSPDLIELPNTEAFYAHFEEEDCESIDENESTMILDQHDINDVSSLHVESYREYEENLQLDNNQYFEKPQLDLKEQRSKACHRSKKYIEDAYGIINIGNSCYFNVFIQLVLTLPNFHNLLRVEERAPENDKELFTFIQSIVTQMSQITHTYNPNLCNFPPTIEEQINRGGSPDEFIVRFLDLTKISIFVLEPEIISIGQFFENQTIERLLDIVIFISDNEIRQNELSAPWSFRYKEYLFCLKFLSTHLPYHFISYLRRGTKEEFLEINEDKVRKASKINADEVYLLLYLKII